MERASEAFRTISRGAYSRLESQLTDKGEVLLGICAGGDTKIKTPREKSGSKRLVRSPGQIVVPDPLCSLVRDGR